MPYLFEVKDFRSVAIENQKRQRHELPLEIGLKARDTIAGLLGMVALDKQDQLSQRWIDAIREKHTLRVVALVAADPDRPSEPRTKRLVWEQVRADQMKQRLAWLTQRVAVRDPLRDDGFLAQLGIVATSQPGAGPARRA